MTRGTQVYVLFSALFAPHLGGVESYTAGLAGELARRGRKVAVVTSRLAPEHPDHEVREDGVEVFRLPCSPLLGGRLPLPRRNAEHARMLDEVAALRPTRVVVNTRFYGHSADGARFAAKLGVPAIVIEHGSAHLSLGNAALDRVVEAYEHRVTKRIAAFGMPFYGVSGACLNWLRHFGIEGAGVIPNSVDMGAYAQAASERDFRAELGLAKDELLVASVGRLVPEKGVGALLNAARLLEGEGFAFAFAGDGPLLEAVEAEAKKRNAAAESNEKTRKDGLVAASPGNGNGAEGNGGETASSSRSDEGSEGNARRADGNGNTRSKVFALGRLAPADTAALLRAADAYCLPSRSEGFATTLLEACAMGTFPIVTEVGGVKELGIGRIGGIVLDEASGSCVAEALRRVKAERAKCAAEGVALREAASANNSWSASADALERAFASFESRDPERIDGKPDDAAEAGSAKLADEASGEAACAGETAAAGESSDANWSGGAL